MTGQVTVKQVLDTASQVVQQQPQKAAELCNQVIQAAPNHDRAYYILGQSAIVCNDFHMAAQCFAKALELNNKHAPYASGLAQLWLNGGKWREAKELARQATELDPTNAAAYLVLAQAHSHNRQYDDAIAMYQKALEHMDVNHPQYVITYEVIMHIYEMRRDDKKIGELLAQLHEKRPDMPPLVMQVQYKRRKGNLEGAIEDAKTIIASPAGAMQKAKALVELGHIYDKQGEYDKAFEVNKEGQALARDTASVGEDPQKIDPFDALIDASQAWFAEDKVKGWDTPIEDDIQAPVFVMGFPRSGTTLTEQILASHSKNYVLEEVDLVSGLILTGLGKVLGHEVSYPDILPELTEEEIKALRRLYFSNLQDYMNQISQTILEGKQVIDKLPLNLNHLGMIQRIFPEAKVIVVLRDPRDCCFSCFMQFFRHNAGMKHFYTLDGAVNAYDRSFKLYLLYKDILSLDIMEFRYEDMVEDQEGTTRKIINHLGLEWDDALLEFYKTEHKVHTPSYEGVSQPIYKQSKARWKHYEQYFEPYQDQLKPYLEVFGYEVV